MGSQMDALAAVPGSKAKGHNDECRQRIEEKMQAEKEGRERLNATLPRRHMFSAAATATGTATASTDPADPKHTGEPTSRKSSKFRDRLRHGSA